VGTGRRAAAPQASQEHDSKLLARNGMDNTQYLHRPGDQLSRGRTIVRPRKSVHRLTKTPAPRVCFQRLSALAGDHNALWRRAFADFGPYGIHSLAYTYQQQRECVAPNRCISPRLSAWAADPDALWQRPFIDFGSPETLHWHQRKPSAQTEAHSKAVCMGRRPRCSLAAFHLLVRGTQHPFANVSQHVLLRDTPTKLGPSPHQPYKASLGCLEDLSEAIVSTADPGTHRRGKSTLACSQGSGRSCVASDMPARDRSSPGNCPPKSESQA